MTRFRPCIDLHQGRVKQIVGGTLKDSGDGPVENFVATHDAAWFADRYRQDELRGGHVIQLGPGNGDAARSALQAYPGGLQIGGGITSANAAAWLDAGASHVIVTSWLFDRGGHLVGERIEELVRAVGRDRLVLDLSCRRTGEGAGTGPTWRVAMNRWQTLTEVEITAATLSRLAAHCDQFLIHAADVEGLCQGIDAELVEALGKWAEIPMTYAGGVGSWDDIAQVRRLSGGRVDITVGSALDLFGGTKIRYDDLVRWDRDSSK